MKDHLSGLTARVVPGAAGLALVSGLRAAAYGAEPEDAFDGSADHLIVEGPWGAEAALRLFFHGTVDDARRGYTGARYDLRALGKRRGPFLELGRFCFSGAEPEALRVLYGALAQTVARGQIGYLFGCTSLPGADPVKHRSSLAFLAQGFADPGAPPPLCPEVAPIPQGRGDPRGLPPLLRSYLAMGARVGRQAVIDHGLDTLHLFTGLDPRDVPGPRRRSLTRLAVELARG